MSVLILNSGIFLAGSGCPGVGDQQTKHRTGGAEVHAWRDQTSHGSSVHGKVKPNIQVHQIKPITDRKVLFCRLLCRAPSEADLQRLCPFIRILDQWKSNFIHHLHSSSRCLLKIKLISCRCSFHLNNLCLTLETKHLAHLKWPKCAFLNKGKGRVIFTPSQTEKLEKKACVGLRVFHVNFRSVKGW